VERGNVKPCIQGVTS